MNTHKKKMRVLACANVSVGIWSHLFESSTLIYLCVCVCWFWTQKQQLRGKKEYTCSIENILTFFFGFVHTNIWLESENSTIKKKLLCELPA